MRYCSLDSCDKKHYCKDYCEYHYRKFRKYGDPEAKRRRREIHGLNKLYPREYQAWCAMKSRVRATTSNYYPSYRQRGIKVCDRWEESFRAFFEDMGQRPSPQHSLDRINNDGNYEPSNCRWAVVNVQNWNRRRNKRNTSGFVGVKQKGLGWEARIFVNRKYFILGRFGDIEEAALMYDRAAIFFRGDYADTNILKH